MVTVRTMATAHNPAAITKKVFFDMEIGGNKAGESQLPVCPDAAYWWQSQAAPGSPSGSPSISNPLAPVGGYTCFPVHSTM